MQAIRVERQIGGKTLAIESGTFAKLADGSVTVQYGDSVVFGAVVRANPREGIDFFPLQVDYRERRAAAGKFPGGFMKREGRPTTKEILTSRLIDRPIRPLFPLDYINEVQIMTSAMSADPTCGPRSVGRPPRWAVCCTTRCTRSCWHCRTTASSTPPTAQARSVARPWAPRRSRPSGNSAA